MKKTVSFLVFLVASFLFALGQVGAEILVTSAQPITQAKVEVVNVEAPKMAEQSAPHDYALESFGCCGLPQ